MNTLTAQRIVTDFGQLSLFDQIALLERLIQQIRQHTTPAQPPLASQLAAMALDPEIQQELRDIAIEFAETETDGLGSTQ